MRDGKCIKCGGEVRQLTKGIERGNNSALYVRGASMINHPSSYETFLCTACGYYEDYITDLEKLRGAGAGEGGWAPPA